MITIDLGKEAFNAKQARSLTGITQKQVVYWDKRGIVKPSIASAWGRGSRRLYSYMDLLALMTVKSLRDEGVSLQRVRKCVLYLRRHMPDISQPLNICRLITDGETVYLVEDKKTLIDTVARPGQRAFLQLVDIAAFDRELRSRVLKLTTKRVESVAVGDYAYQVEIEPDPEEGGYVATVAGLPGCITDGETFEEVLINAEDAIECWLEARQELAGRGVRVPVTRRRRRARA